MLKNCLSLTVINIAFYSLVSSSMSTKTLAQEKKPLLDKEQCIQSLVKEGLKSTQASVWCNYQEECLVKSQEEGLPLESAQTVCQCTISEFRNKYSTEKFKELTQQVNTDRKVARELRDVGEMCFEQILFE